MHAVAVGTTTGSVVPASPVDPGPCKWRCEALRRALTTDAYLTWSCWETRLKHKPATFRLPVASLGTPQMENTSALSTPGLLAITTITHHPPPHATHLPTFLTAAETSTQQQLK
uniref:Uncharacterized protein n=1 Tax=Chlamydomonas euryale TaxID=1486919 RepID=A0A7R9VWU3_9CHLO|eukprot:366456-Chlamydomonas_euryale.AAC.1